MRQLWLMGTSRRRAMRQHALDVSQCVAASFGERRVEWEEFVSTGRLVVWDRHPLPLTPAVAAEKERLLAHRRKLDAQQAGN